MRATLYIVSSCHLDLLCKFRHQALDSIQIFLLCWVQRYLVAETVNLRGPFIRCGLCVILVILVTFFLFVAVPFCSFMIRIPL